MTAVGEGLAVVFAFFAFTAGAVLLGAGVLLGWAWITERRKDRGWFPVQPEADEDRLEWTPTRLERAAVARSSRWN